MIRLSPLSRRLVRCATLAASLWLAAPGSAQVLSYTFNDPAGNIAVNKGTGGAVYNLTMFDATGAPTDLHSNNTKKPGGSSSSTAARRST